VIEPWQIEDFRALDDPQHRHAYLERPRGHSKTGDLGTEAVVELVLGPPGQRLIDSMYRISVGSTVLLRHLLLFAILILLPTWAQAASFSFEGGSGCDDPPIFSQVFTFTANSNGGFCTGFGNHSGVNFDSLRFVRQFRRGGASNVRLFS
jgi:hypothetical protein